MKKGFTKEDFYALLKENDNGCLEWTMHTNNKGYGQTYVKNRDINIDKPYGKDVLTHRLSMILENINIDGLSVCHKCDNPLCCNPNHLFVGTHQDNMNDMVAKGRQYVKKRYESNHK